MISCSNHKEALISCSLAWDGCWSLYHHIWSLQLISWKFYLKASLEDFGAYWRLCVSSCCVCLRCVVKPSIVETPNSTLVPNSFILIFSVDLFLWIHLLSFLIFKFPKSFSKLPSVLIFSLSVLYWPQNHFCPTCLLFLACFLASFMLIGFSDSNVLVFKNPYFR